MNATGTTILLYLTPEEAELMTALKQSNALGMRYGKLIISFHEGFLQNIIKEEMIVKRNLSKVERIDLPDSPRMR